MTPSHIFIAHENYHHRNKFNGEVIVLNRHKDHLRRLNTNNFSPEQLQRSQNGPENVRTHQKRACRFVETYVNLRV